jgi:hypothetical protein
MILKEESLELGWKALSRKRGILLSTSVKKGGLGWV